MAEYLDRYLLFIEYFNNLKFMPAQTTLDEVWLHEEGQDRDFYEGLIQVAVSMYHLTNDNPQGAAKIFAKAKGMLNSYSPHYKDINVGKLLSDLDILFNEQLGEQCTKFDYLRLVPHIEILHH